jgi:hypothetical protein
MLHPLHSKLFSIHYFGKQAEDRLHLHRNIAKFRWHRKLVWIILVFIIRPNNQAVSMWCSLRLHWMCCVEWASDDCWTIIITQLKTKIIILNDYFLNLLGNTTVHTRFHIKSSTIHQQLQQDCINILSVVSVASWCVYLYWLFRVPFFNILNFNFLFPSHTHYMLRPLWAILKWII